MLQPIRDGRPVQAEPENTADVPAGALAGLRVLDLTDDELQYCGKLLAQMGADVCLVEPIGGCRTRRNGPFIDDRADLEQSLTFAYFNQGKKGVCVDLGSIDGRAMLHKLASQADVILHSFLPTEAKSLGIVRDALKDANPAVVVTAITGFGNDGPCADWQYNDLTCMAMGGLLYLGGYPDTGPIGAPGGQAYLAAAQFAAVATLAAVLQAETSGLGREIDVSVQECVAMALENAVQFYDLEEVVRKRNGGEQRQAGTGVFPCRDGLVYLMAGGIASNRFWATTTEWLIESGAPGAGVLRGPEWNDQNYLQTDEAKKKFAAIFLPFAASRTKAELYEGAQSRRIPISPVSTTRDLLENRQLAHRQFFVEAFHPQSGKTIQSPGAPYRLSASPWRLGRPAPRLGEHTFDVLQEFEVSPTVQEVLCRAGACV